MFGGGLSEIIASEYWKPKEEGEGEAAGTACATVLGQDQTWHVGGTARSLTWLEQSEQGGEEER